MAQQGGKELGCAFTWSKQEAYSNAKSQSGASNCGATALLNVLLALDQPLPSVRDAEDAVHTNQRQYGVSVSKYLAARSIAGCTGENIVAGCDAVAGDNVISRFFAFYPPRRVDLQDWLAQWLGMGCSAIATLNTQLMYGADYWHHQMIFGVDSSGVHVTNGVETLSFPEIHKGLESPAELQIQPGDCLNCHPWDPEACDALGPRWQELRVSQQLATLKEAGPKKQHVVIPAAYKAGITVFARKGSSEAQQLLNAPELPLNETGRRNSRAGSDEYVETGAKELGVPAELLTSFNELCATLEEKAGARVGSRQHAHGVRQIKLQSDLQEWRKHLEQARAMAEVAAFLQSRHAEVQAALTAAQHLASGAVSPERALRYVKSRAMVRAVYNPAEDLADALQKSLEEGMALMRPTEQPAKVIVQRGVYTKDHAGIRERAYPYVPAFGDSTGEAVIEAVSEKGALLGYVILNGAYVFDLAVDPCWAGTGVASALVAAAGKVLEKEGEKKMRLDVRMCNEPALAFYESLGFEKTERSFPPWYDWHGGYSMCARCPDIARQLGRNPKVQSKV